MSSKKKVELLGSPYKGTTILADTVVTLSESCWERVAQNAHLNCPLRDKGFCREKVDWKVSLIPENEKQPLSPLYS